MDGRPRRSVSTVNYSNLDKQLDHQVRVSLREHERKSPTLDRDARKRKRESDSPKQVHHTALRSGLRNSVSTSGEVASIEDGDKEHHNGFNGYSRDTERRLSDANEQGAARHVIRLNVRQPTIDSRSSFDGVDFVSEAELAHPGNGSAHQGDNLAPNIPMNGSYTESETHEDDAVVRTQRALVQKGLNSDDEESEELYTPRKSSRRARPTESGTSDADTAVRGNRRLIRGLQKPHNKRKQRGKIQSDEDEYIDGDDTGEGEEFGSDDFLQSEQDDMNDFVENDQPSRPKRRSQRFTQDAQPRVKRTRSRRVRASDEDFSGQSSPTDLQAELAELRPERKERQRQLRDRTNRPDYAIPPPLTDQMLGPASSTRKTNLNLRSSFRSLYPEYGTLGLGLPSDMRNNFGNFGPPAGLQSDSDSSDEEGQTHKTAAKAVANALLPAMKSMDQSGPGIPNNLGKIKGSNLADADPIGIDKTVSFDSVGGLQDHIDQLKEMVSLPLLYPEIFQRFHITPPRGVLFHGPPGTGKTLMARALAASCSSEGRKISFYMRKGADCLSKWVGEAERQLRLLFDEAKANQPSIIFFDEIDGLAPVRSAKQDQIHASIVSTLLALMDGMDARGQVVVIGATNRPDSVDPALRRPGRFDREFYFPLPSLNARSQILTIHTGKWEPPLSKDFISQLALQTKGYGGADLRALCTEAALNAVQRRYPQIYMSSVKLVIDPATINVAPRDFMSAIKKIIPSSARSSASGAAMLPTHLKPLLDNTLAKATSAIDELVPRSQSKTALEANLDDNGDESTFEKENMRQMLEHLRTYRPRVLLTGPPGHGQQHLGRAILHHLEGFHVQNIDLAMMFSDSASTAEASLIQSFTEAKRHKPTILFMPSVELWFQAASENVVATLRSLLSTISANEPLLLLGIADVPKAQIHPDILDIFGYHSKVNIELRLPTGTERAAFLGFIGSLLRKPPTDFPEAVPTRGRQLEVLPVAPPKAPNEPSKAERKALLIKDRKTKLVLKARLGPLMELIRTRYKRFKKPAIDEKQIAHLLAAPGQVIPDDIGNRDYQNTEDGMILEISTEKKFFNTDINLIEERLWNNLYLSPRQFQNDIEQILHDAKQEEGDRERVMKAQEMHTNVLMHLEDMFDATFLEECKSMALREVARHKEFHAASVQKEQSDGPKEIERQRANSLHSLQPSPVLSIRSPRLGDTDLHDERDTSQPQTRGDQAPSIDVQMIENSPTHGQSRVEHSIVDEDAVAVNPHDVHEKHDINIISAAATTPIEVLSESAPVFANHGDIVTSPLAASILTGSPAVELPSREPDAGAHGAVESGPEPEDASLTEHPAFELDDSYLRAAEQRWTTSTEGFNIDRLEQLNSCAVDIIWSQRSNWNRNEVLYMVESAIAHYLSAVADHAPGR